MESNSVTTCSILLKLCVLIWPNLSTMIDVCIIKEANIGLEQLSGQWVTILGIFTPLSLWQKHDYTPLIISITIIHAPNHHQQTVQRWWKDHFLGVMFPHPLSNQCFITTAVIIIIVGNNINILVIIIIIIVEPKRDHFLRVMTHPHLPH